MVSQDTVSYLLEQWKWCREAAPLRTAISNRHMPRQSMPALHMQVRHTTHHCVLMSGIAELMTTCSLDGPGR